MYLFKFRQIYQPNYLYYVYRNPLFLPLWSKIALYEIICALFYLVSWSTQHLNKYDAISTTYELSTGTPRYSLAIYGMHIVQFDKIYDGKVKWMTLSLYWIYLE